MAAPKSRKLKTIGFTLGGSAFEQQITTWNLTNNTDTGDTTLTFGGNPDDPTASGAIVEDTDPDWTLDVTFLSDWASGGISDYLTVHDGETVAFTIDHLPNQVGEHVRFVGQVKLQAPTVGGDAGATEETDVSLKVAGAPTYSRIG